MKRWLRSWARRRDTLRERPVADFVYRVVVGVVGLSVLLVGIVAIPYPGPGWAIVFLGLAILATEFYWAHRTLSFTRSRYDSAMGWFRSQGRVVQALGAVFTAAVVVATLWLVGAVGWSAGLLGLDHPALDSPIGLGA
ncbi:TIGR02611 family protein [Mycobacterium sp. RTGN5]|uniref:TIGR02611 family protein n=1 Tax=Mycobacterium sp. RTGN5 TaxID=3016522 RepID=UPI0029C9033C|nr:TIGR02611 family protein [Mycobacterium sp. RTGN5]